MSDNDTEVRYPEVQVILSGHDGNAAAIIGSVMRALRRAKVGPGQISQFAEEARSADYDHVIQTAMRWVDVR